MGHGDDTQPPDFALVALQQLAARGRIIVYQVEGLALDAGHRAGQHETAGAIVHVDVGQELTAAHP